jgi:hypothetical protein
MKFPNLTLSRASAPVHNNSKIEMHNVKLDKRFGYIVKTKIKQMDLEDN